MKTPIQEAIDHIEQDLDYSSFIQEKEEGAAEFRKLVIEYLKGLLPKEQDTIVNFAERFNANYDLPNECIDEGTEGGRFCSNRMDSRGKCQLCLDVEGVFTETFNK